MSIITQANTIQYKLTLEFYTNRVNFTTIFVDFKKIVVAFAEQYFKCANAEIAKQKYTVLFTKMFVISSRRTSRPGIVSTSSMAFKKRGKEHININKTCVKATLVFNMYSCTKIEHERFSTELHTNMVHARFADSQIKSLQITTRIF
jgi:hypothetical protein